MSGDRPLVGIVDYQAGNIQSIENAFDHLGARTVRVRVEADIEGATHLLLPGVGAFGFCAEELRATGLVERLRHWALDERRPMLGICVGMQLMADVGHEMGRHDGLGWIGGAVSRLHSSDATVRIPHVGWNEAVFLEGFGEFGRGDRVDFYFDHSFAYHNPVYGHRVAICSHGEEFCAFIRRDNLIAAQFHPEKSQGAGLKFLSGFLAMNQPC